jgi:hypothetical protein
MTADRSREVLDETPAVKETGLAFLESLRPFRGSLLPMDSDFLCHMHRTLPPAGLAPNGRLFQCICKTMERLRTWSAARLDHAVMEAEPADGA